MCKPISHSPKGVGHLVLWMFLQRLMSSHYSGKICTSYGENKMINKQMEGEMDKGENFGQIKKHYQSILTACNPTEWLRIREAALTFSVFITRLHLQLLNQSALWNFQVSVSTLKQKVSTAESGSPITWKTVHGEEVYLPGKWHITSLRLKSS